jgi:hypothetical protein
MEDQYPLCIFFHQGIKGIKYPQDSGLLIKRNMKESIVALIVLTIFLMARVTVNSVI